MSSKNLKQLMSLFTIAVAILGVSTTAFTQSQNVAASDTSSTTSSEPKSDLKLNVTPAEKIKAEPKQDLTATVDPDGKDVSFDAGKAFEKVSKETAPKVLTSNYSLDRAKLSKQTDPADNDWQVAFAPYLYMTGFSGTVGARGRVVEVDASFGSVLENLSFGLMGALEAKKGRFIFTNDIIWTKMGVERNTPGAAYNTARADVNMFIFDPEAGYRLYEGKGGSFDVLGGIRLWSVENSLETTTGLLPGFRVSERKTWVAFVGGFHGVVNLSPKLFLATKFDIGAGSGTDITTQFYGGAGFRIKPKAALIGGYRYMKVNHDDNSGFIFNTSMNGIVLGAKFNF